ncbi:protein TIFY 5A-like [Primulina eburnea]|uniref:protein TIFY 5A-like n=1 Tax=Primulina eburnea TaxID=1245227 RepID=UPI003C6BD813
MKRNCNLELRLVKPAHPVFSNDINIGGQTPNPIYKELTVFYKGEVCVSDVTELQARAIILLASREMEEKSPGSKLNSPLCSPTTGLYMKRSLQRFLQKRKTRSQETSPYPVNSGHPN